MNCTVRVAVIDDGVEAHPELTGRLLPGFSVGSSTGGGAPHYSTHGHGQACAGILGAARDNVVGIAGIASHAQIVPVSIGHSSVTLEDVADAIDWAWDDGEADVISCSWGSIYCDDIVAAIDRARTQGRDNRGAVVVFASGNDYPASVAFPANVSGVVTVGAIERNGGIWAYSQRGPEMDLVAPSGNVNLLGDVYTIDRVNANGYNSGDYMTNFGGTSAAAPQVSGVAALILTVNPSLTEVQVKNILQQTATDMGTTGFDNIYGYGRVDAQAAVQASLPSITGPDQFCGTATYTIDGVPAGASAAWESSPYYTITPITPNGSQVTITESGAGGLIGVLRATITTDCGSTVLQKFVTLGGITNFYATCMTNGVTNPLENCNRLYLNPAYPNMYSGEVEVTSPSTGSVTCTLVSKTPSTAIVQLLNPSPRKYIVNLRGSSTVAVYKITVSNSCGSYSRNFTFRGTACPPTP